MLLYKHICSIVHHNQLVLKITSITSANPAKVTTSYPHKLQSNDLIIIVDVEGMEEVNYKTFAIEPTIGDEYAFTLNQYPHVTKTQSSTE